MYKIYLYISFLIIFTNCTLKEVERHHGLHYLDKKNDQLTLNISNKNDILELLGPPSTKGSFDNDVWIYIELKEKKQSLFKLGKTEIDINNILIIEVDTKGLLAKKTFFNIDDMNKITLLNLTTDVAYKKNNFIFNFLSSMRQKINDPLGKRKVGGNRR
tara:strand:+ start:2845 stop:3321 length:477 start_codon:yes stop_codon:yes gene_type:complete